MREMWHGCFRYRCSGLERKIIFAQLSYPWIYSIFAHQKFNFLVHICIINFLDFLIIETLASHVGLLIEKVLSPSLLNLLIPEYSERTSKSLPKN